MEQILLALMTVVVGYLLYLNRKQRREREQLKELIALKDTTISNLQASRVAVKEVIENFSLVDSVMEQIKKGKSRESIAKILGITVDRVEVIVKIEKIKHASS